MNLTADYRRQFDWRPWERIFDELPLLPGHTVLDLGCGVGDQAAEFVARGVRVVGVEINEELLREARSRQVANAEFRLGDLREPLELDAAVDGLWCSFAAAYFPDLPEALALWSRNLRPGGWVALTEVDNLFGHEPLGSRTESLLEAYVRDAFTARRYDFHMGRKLENHLRQSGLIVLKSLTLEDQELAFDGPARPEVVDAWRNRLERMTLLREYCGPDFDQVRLEFLDCLARPDHRTAAKIYCCIAAK